MFNDFRYNYYFLLAIFSHQRWLSAFHWCLGDRKTFQVSKILRCILDDLKNAGVWISLFVIQFLIFFQPPYQTFGDNFQQNTTTTGVTFMFHCFLVLWQDLYTWIFFRILWFSLFAPPPGKAKSTSRLVLIFFLLTITLSVLLTGITILLFRDFSLHR